MLSGAAPCMEGQSDASRRTADSRCERPRRADSRGRNDREQAEQSRDAKRAIRQDERAFELDVEGSQCLVRHVNLVLTVRSFERR